ncbi:CHAT domain-containing protein [Rathayibacter sp. KR2-224]|uniref:CHAT domain-containing protein n=1 Tax=Rathayibacter sp. KR2-224 TaxID=3400913 RepID=UPI003C0377F4
MLTALEYYERGLTQSNAGRHAAARRSLVEAATRAEDANLRARIAGTRAYLLIAIGRLDEAAELCRDAIRIGGISEHTRSVLLGQSGLVALRRGDLHEALRLFTIARRGLEEDPVSAGTIAMNRGNTLLDLGRFEDARIDFGEAARLLHTAGLSDDAAKATHNQGYASLLAGDLVSALRYMEAARSRASAASAVDAAVGDVDRAEALVAAGMAFEASAVLAKAAAVYSSRRLRLRQADVVWRRARTLLYLDLAAAVRQARSASRLYESHGNLAGALRARAVALRASVANGGRSQRLLDELDDVSTQLARHGLHEDARELRLIAARVRVRRGGVGAARDALKRIRVAGAAPITRRLLAREVRAEAASVLFDDRRAAREASRGLDELAEWQALFGSVDLQASTAMHGQSLVKAGISAALRSGESRNVFEWSERARSIASHSVSPRPPTDAKAAADLARLRALRVAADPGPEAQRLEAQLRERIRIRQWAKTGAGVVAQLASLDDAHSALDAETVLVAYVWSGQRLVALIVENDVSRTIELSPGRYDTAERAALFADLDVHAARLGGAMGEAVEASLRGRLEMLDELLIAPIMSASPRAARDGSRFVVVAPGVLAGVPWTMLPGLAGHAVALPPSATRWIAEQERGTHRRGSAGFVVGPRVPRGAEEAMRAASGWADARVIEGVAATTDEAAGLAAAVDVFHLTGHGRHAADNPYFSGIELADGPWFGYDVERIQHLPETVLISACELGRSSVGWGHEALGMARTWLHAGTRSVIASPVSVNDDDACEVLSAVHEGLSCGAGPAVALARAQARTGIVTPFLCYGAGW